MKLIALSSIACFLATISAGYNDVYWYGLPTKKNGGAWYAGDDVDVIMCWERNTDKKADQLKFKIDSKYGFEHKAIDFQMQPLDQATYQSILGKTAQAWGKHAPPGYEGGAGGMGQGGMDLGEDQTFGTPKSGFSPEFNGNEDGMGGDGGVGGFEGQGFDSEENARFGQNQDEFGGQGGFGGQDEMGGQGGSGGQGGWEEQSGFGGQGEMGGQGGWEEQGKELRKRSFFGHTLFSSGKDGGSVFDVPKESIGESSKNGAAKCFYASFKLKDTLDPKFNYQIEASRWRKMYMGKTDMDSPRFVILRPPHTRSSAEGEKKSGAFSKVRGWFSSKFSSKPKSQDQEMGPGAAPEKPSRFSKFSKLFGGGQ